ETIQDVLVSPVEGFPTQSVAVLAQLDGVLEQGEKRLNERPHGRAGQFVTQLGQFPQQVDQAALLRAVQAVVRRVEIADQGACKPQMAEQTGATDGQAEEVVQQVARFAQGDAQVGAAVAGE